MNKDYSIMKTLCYTKSRLKELCSLSCDPEPMNLMGNLPSNSVLTEPEPNFLKAFRNMVFNRFQFDEDKGANEHLGKPDHCRNID